MRTVDPLGRHDDCSRIVEAVEQGHRVVLVGHPLLGSDAVRRRVSHALVRTDDQRTVTFHSLPDPCPGAAMCAVQSSDGSLDTLHTPEQDDDESPPVVVRLVPLTRRQFDRLADDRLARAGLPSDWLSSTARSMVHAASHGYPLLAAAMLDDQLRPSRFSRATAVAAAIVRALEPELRVAAEIIASVPGIRNSRAVAHLGEETVATLRRIGIVDEIAGAFVIPPALRCHLLRRKHDRTVAILAEIAQGWSRREVGTASEYIATHEAFEAGQLSAPVTTRAGVAALAACSLVSKSLTGPARLAAARARELDPSLLPRALKAIATGELAVAGPLIEDAAERGFDPFASRLLGFVVAASVLAPERSGSELLHLLPASSDTTARLVRIRELVRAREALGTGDHETLTRSVQVALIGGDPLVSLRAFGLLACDAAFRGDAAGVIAAADGVHRLIGQVQDFTRAVLSIAGRTIAETRMAARAIGLPPSPLLEAALDRIVEIAAAADEPAAIAYAVVARHAEVGTPEHAAQARAVLMDLPDEPPRRQALAALEAFERGPAALQGMPDPATALVFSGLVAEVVTAAEDADGDAARRALTRCEELETVGVPPTVPERVAAASLRARLGLPVPSLDDIDTTVLSPVLQALAALATAGERRDATALLEAASGIASARHEALTTRLLDEAAVLGAASSAIERVRDELAASVAAALRTLRGSRAWVDRDILGLAAAGLTDLQISQLLDLPLGTVRARSRSVMARLGIPSRSGLASAC